MGRENQHRFPHGAYMILRRYNLEEDVRVIEKYKMSSLHVPWLDGGTSKNKYLEDRVERTRKSETDIWRR